MRTYRIVYLQDAFYETVKVYPKICHQLYFTQIDPYSTKQVELLYRPIYPLKTQLLSYLQTRDDYQNEKGIHTLINALTHEKILITFHEYDIEVYEEEHKSIIYDILHNFSENVYMMDE